VFAILSILKLICKIKINKSNFLLIPLVSVLFNVNLLAGGSKDYLSISTALFDVIQNNVNSLEGRIEYRINSIDWRVKPLTGLMINTDGGLYMYSGLFFEIPITKYFSLVPSFSPGIYFKNYSKDLHFVLEFKSQMDLIFNISEEFMTGFSFNHISNASLGDKNPGVESIAITFLLPLRR
jgi:hypothetical protein